jgi:predicted Holliday junction resolvase-like endonuclease
MSAGKYWLLTFLSLVIAALILIEIVCENQVALLTTQFARNQAVITQAQQQSASVRQLVQRIAAESERDPALLELLTKRGIRVSKNTGDVVPPAPVPLSAPPPK